MNVRKTTNFLNKISFLFTGLTLVSAPHLARSYQHLFPLEAFKEVEKKDMSGDELKYVHNFFITYISHILWIKIKM